ncbi:MULTISPECIES: TetR/AcrR family transcriptional regulator [Thermocrispum]|uniref:TetR/AcrR family transcriptional regulator n=2 Tax=Thermocrispum agreste TaxID=37925 RepID=A0ABD6FF03_9PSEU|nr:MULTISPECIES: TetR/AcrR family transcriptional regulator [Thermocrispum]
MVGEQLTSLRRQPVQQRSALRVARMLDAAAELLDEVGYERLTTTAIAKRAGVAVGSLYQFFPDKRAVVQALTQRNLERFMSLAAERLAAVDHQHWWDVVDGLLDIYLEMHHETPGFSRIHFGDAVDPRLLDGSRTNNDVVAEALMELLTGRIDLPPEQVVAPIKVAVEVADALLKYAFRADPKGDPAVIEETKHLIKIYLESRFGQ